MSDQKMINVDFTGVEEAKNDGFPERLTPEVYDLTITGLEFGVSTGEKQTPYAEFTFVAEGKGQHKDKFYLTVAALPRLKHMLLACGVAEDVLSNKMTGEQLVKVSTGKQFTGRLSGREYINKNKEVAMASEFAFSNFAQPLNSTDRLTFSPDKHIKRLPKQVVDSASSNGSESFTLTPPVTNDLPF